MVHCSPCFVFIFFMFEAMVMVKGPEYPHWKGLGSKSFRLFPQVGEFLEFGSENSYYLYKVVAIIHPSEPAQYPADIYAVQVGRSHSVIKTLFEAS